MRRLPKKELPDLGLRLELALKKGHDQKRRKMWSMPISRM
jgi:hypothetical protein